LPSWQDTRNNPSISTKEADKVAQGKRRLRLSRRQFLLSSGAALAAACAPAGGPGASPGPSGPPLKIGQILPFTQVYADLGNSMRRAADLYKKLTPTIAGRPIELLYEDEANQAPVAQQKARKFIEQDQVDVIMGIVPTPVSYALRDLVHNAQTIFICTNAGGNWLTRAAGSVPNQPASKSKYIFRTSFSSWQISQPIGEWLATKRNVKEVQVSYANYGFGIESATDFGSGLTKGGGRVVPPDVKPPLGNADFGPFVQQIRSNPTKATYHFYSGADAQKFLTTWDQLGMRQAGYVIYGTGFLTEQDVLQNTAAAKAAIGAVTALHWAVTLENPENRQFVDAYRNEYNQLPDVFAVQSWDGMRAFDEAVKKLNGDTSDKEKLIRALEDVKFNSPRGPFEFDKDSHNVIHDIYIRETKEQGGQVVNTILDKITRVTDPGK
jgi:branched-chain amino acid transport system substrate-binding protein